jgi:hypothetical protein
VSNALGVDIQWESETRTVEIDSSKSSEIQAFFDMEISSVESGQVINGTITLDSELPRDIPSGASRIEYLLIDPSTYEGFVIARGDVSKTDYEWLPSVEDDGEKILVAALYNSDGVFLCGDCVSIQVDIIPEVTLTGLYENQMVETNTSYPLKAEMNFSAAYVKYEFKSVDTGDVVYLSGQLDPLGTFNMVPAVEDNGNLSVRVIAYDMEDQAYFSPSVNYSVDVDRVLSLGGVSDEAVIDGTVTLYTYRNFNVTDTQYIMKDVDTGEETVLADVGYGSYTWFPGPELAGSKELYVKVKDTVGDTYTSDAVTVTVKGSPKLLLKGVGPGQIVTGQLNLSVLSNVTLDSVEYILTNDSTGVESTIDANFTPVDISGSWTMRAEGIYNGSEKITTEDVSFTINLNKTYSAQPIVEKSEFLDLASDLAVDTQEEEGMSAALQIAQAILETGWGQSVPVDKYDGQFSNNLFGIKGTGTAGSVTSNTWEEYNGVSYRIDAEFRAYNNVSESWEDHNDLLLNASRYEPFREVMYDSTQGAWALKRCGYATDSSYPIKLMEIIYYYDLKELDKVSI